MTAAPEPDRLVPAWFAVHTRSRHERKVRDELGRRAFEVFLPEYQSWSRRRDRRKRILKPLFPGYLFVHTALTPPLRLGLLQTKSVVRLVGVRQSPVPIPDREIESIRILLGATTEVAPCPALSVGKLVLVMEGPMRGVIGVVESTDRKRIVVAVELLGRAVSATLDTDAVAPYLDG
jgi:transcription antitermination factor NusG